jgi:hypothetical protein
MTTTARLSLPLTLAQPTKVRLEVLSLSGAVVWQQPTDVLPTGTHTLHIPLQSLAAGTWLCRLSTPQGTLTRTFVTQ